MEKESIGLHVMWHIDVLLQAYPVTIVTTVDSAGQLNAAPYSLVLPYCSSPKNPQMLLIVNKTWHTAKNIVETGEFVLNYPGAGQVKDIVETSRYYEAGVNEIECTNPEGLLMKAIIVNDPGLSIKLYYSPSDICLPTPSQEYNCFGFYNISIVNEENINLMSMSFSGDVFKIIGLII